MNLQSSNVNLVKDFANLESSFVNQFVANANLETIFANLILDFGLTMARMGMAKSAKGMANGSTADKSDAHEFGKKWLDKSKHYPLIGP